MTILIENIYNPLLCIIAEKPAHRKIFFKITIIYRSIFFKILQLYRNLVFKTEKTSIMIKILHNIGLI